MNNTENIEAKSNNQQKELKRFRVEIPVKALKSLWLESLPFYSFFVFQMIFFLSIYNFENPLVFIFIWWGLVPLLELYYPEDRYNYSKEDTKRLKENNLIFMIPIYLPVLFDIFLHFYFMGLLSSSQKTLWFKAFLVFGYGETLAYLSELTHATAHYITKFDKIVSYFSLLKVFYLHFPYEHNQGHHLTVGTENDPFFAKKGTRIYPFIRDSLVKEYFSFLEISRENTYLKKLKFSESNQVLLLYLFFLILYLFLYGQIILPYLLILFLYVSIFNAIINYLSHYGLERKKKVNGEYEPQSHLHSWNYFNTFSNFLLFRGQRHSDHHLNPNKPYQCLYLKEESPIIPSNKAYTVYQLLTDQEGYFASMDPIVDLYMNGIKEDEKPKSQKETEEEEAMENLQFDLFKRKIWKDLFFYLVVFIFYFRIENVIISLFKLYNQYL